MPARFQPTPLLSALAVIAGVGIAIAAGKSFRLPPETAKFKAGPGADVATVNCLLCHSADYVSTQPPLSAAQWKAIVQKMQQKYGAPLPADKVDEISDYLVKNYGRESPAK